MFFSFLHLVYLEVIIELFRLENTSKIIESDHEPNAANSSTKPRP